MTDPFSRSVNCTSFILKEVAADNSEPQITKDQCVFLMIVLSALYIPIMVLIFLNRHKQEVYFKSPYMIITGGIGLYLDSMFNVLLMSMGD